MPRLLIILGCALLAACAKNREPDSPANSLVRIFHAASAIEAETLAKNNTIHCAASSNCPASVGQFTGQQGKDVAACTAFLIGDDLAVTNSHCIPSSVKLSPALCADRIRITFPATGGFREESIACKTLEAQSDRPNDISPDLALIRLARGTGRPAFQVHGGVTPGEAFTAYKVNPSRPEPNRLLGELVAETCPAVANTYLFPLYRDAMDSVFAAGCSSVPGNSGSPVVGENGVVGLLQAALQLNEAQRTAWLPYLDKSERGFAPLALGTSMRCLDARNGKVDPSCVPHELDEIERPRLEAFLQSEAWNAEMNALLRPYLEQSSDFALHREIITKSSLERTETLTPRCILPSTGSDPAVSTERLPVFTIKLAFNRYLQASPTVNIEREEQVEFRYSRFDLARAGETKVESSRGAQLLSACTAGEN